MRVAILVLPLVIAVAAGCSSNPPLRSEPVEVTVKVTLPVGSAKDLTVTFNPLDDGLPAAGKVGADGVATLKAIPGKYTFFFSDEANAKVPAYKSVPVSYRTPNKDNTVTLGSTQASVDVK
jgi:hypothetical protein